MAAPTNPAPATAPIESATRETKESAQRFTVEELARNAHRAFGVAPYVVHGALHGQTKLTAENARAKIAAWLKAEVA